MNHSHEPLSGVDVVVLGAGVVGLSAARHLTGKGASVVVLDPSLPGGKGSRAAAGVAIPSIRLFKDPAMLDLARAGMPVLRADLQSLGAYQDGLHRGSGILRVAVDENARKVLDQDAERYPDWMGQWYDQDEVRELEPALNGARLAGAYLHDEAFMVDTEAYLTGLMHELSRKGCRLELGESATEIRESVSGPVKVITQRREISCEKVLVAAGAWSGRINGLDPVPITPLKGEMMSILSPKLKLNRVISAQGYLAPWRCGEIVVGATEEDTGFAGRVTPAGLLYLSAVVARTTPSLRGAKVTKTWAGLRASTPDGRPLIGAYPNTRRVFLASGHGGMGLLSGGYSGREIAQYMDKGVSSLVDRFQPSRVFSKEPVKN